MEFCKDGKHIGVNNTTGRCPVCGEQLESPSEQGFAKAAYLGDDIVSQAFDIMGSRGIMPIVSTQSIHDLIEQKNNVVMIDTFGQSAPHENSKIRMTLEGARLLRQQLDILIGKALSADDKQASIVLDEVFDSSGEGYVLALEIHTEETMWKMSPHYYDYP